ncbi:hypothetical protein TRM7557_00636 [Tritonibacter multivorans]|uniref:TM2 domain-containing protein n=1 Tax=Tritonibacter multivorans TaxID=928856 RepID=A0A0P1G2P4_9RHOB|nr:hypothetical protein [Tritonibacter multivorans]MDA7419671.1 hypothetical protein [Tritonibacter multivorans]CUH75947.1 hypothetical protein TRM7557_00636 [Tritonibacter multivorans]SFC58281.1 hypothetical protein SAMN04488049_103146 [Tritonibacter multivorans]
MSNSEVSTASYGTAVALCGVFGVLGLHHFYLRNFVHGFIDLGLAVLFFVLLFSGHIGLAYLALLVDGLHTIVMFYLLITEQARDGAGRLVKLK